MAAGVSARVGGTSFQKPVKKKRPASVRGALK